MHDLVIIGGGPCGLSVAIAARRAGLDAVVLEKGALTNTIVGYPLQTSFYSTAPNLTIGNIPWATVHPHPTRTEALAYYRAVVEHESLHVNVYEPATGLERAADGTLVVSSLRRDGTTPRYPARAVVVATGSYDTPNRLGVPGADHPKVQHYYTEGHPFHRQQVAVVGGGNSAAEAALDLFYHGAAVTLIHQFAGFDPRVKPWVLADLQAWIGAGQIATFWESRLTDITPTFLTLEMAGGERHTLSNDWIFALIGYRPNTSLLENIGVTVDADAVPAHNLQTLETNVPGIFVAGVLTAGTLPSKVFIENGRDHGPRIVATLRRRFAAE
ncbi:MAG: YpdA family putative bacillithiol disulfide reductase [Herpetosiphonaceae bacterium]|nr:YpdA family putative bacillithiol disulfide reductase [Herpetosiphonaceae bacterium]